MIPDYARPKLASKVRLRFDRHSGGHWLLYPERGMSLNESAARIAQLCTGELTVHQIVDELHQTSQDVPRSRVEEDVQQFLGALQERALLQLE